MMYRLSDVPSIERAYSYRIVFDDGWIECQRLYDAFTIMNAHDRWRNLYAIDCVHCITHELVDGEWRAY